MSCRCVLRDRQKVMSQAELLSVIRCPIVTEKSTRQAEQGQYFFKVASWANKFQIATAVKELFSVEVDKVNTLTVPMRTKRFRGRQGRSSGYKKAMIVLKPGHAIDMAGGIQ